MTSSPPHPREGCCEKCKCDGFLAWKGNARQQTIAPGCTCPCHFFDTTYDKITRVTQKISRNYAERADEIFFKDHSPDTPPCGKPDCKGWPHGRDMCLACGADYHHVHDCPSKSPDTKSCGCDGPISCFDHMVIPKGSPDTFVEGRYEEILAAIAYGKKQGALEEIERVEKEFAFSKPISVNRPLLHVYLSQRRRELE